MMKQNNMDIFSEFLGLETESSTHKYSDEQVELAKQMITLIDSEHWKVFMEQIEGFAKVDRPCEAYSKNPELVNFDVGQKYAFSRLKQFITQQQLILDSYVKNKETQRETQQES